MGQSPQTYVPAPAPAAQQPGWVSRHWKLLLFGGLAVVVIGGALLAGSIMLLVFSVMKASDPYQHAVAVAQANPELQQALGTPIETGWWVTGNVNTSGSSGTADFAIPVHGPKGAAMVYLQASKFAGEWEYRRLEARVESTHARVDLLPPGHAAPEAEAPQ